VSGSAAAVQPQGAKPLAPPLRSSPPPTSWARDRLAPRPQPSDSEQREVLEPRTEPRPPPPRPANGAARPAQLAMPVRPMPERREEPRRRLPQSPRGWSAAPPLAATRWRRGGDAGAGADLGFRLPVACGRGGAGGEAGAGPSPLATDYTVTRHLFGRWNSFGIFSARCWSPVAVGSMVPIYLEPSWA
jgi:hypothetical protein